MAPVGLMRLSCSHWCFLAIHFLLTLSAASNDAECSRHSLDRSVGGGESFLQHKQEWKGEKQPLHPAGTPHETPGNMNALDGVASHLDINAKKALWWQLTQDLARTHELGMGEGVTGTRRSVDLWSQSVANGMAMKKISYESCAETGDGHFLRNQFNSSICKKSLSVDKFDPKSDIKMDLDLAPDRAPGDIKAAHGTIDLLVSHQVFEHLQRPSVGMANLNAMLRTGGVLVFTTPFIIQDHAAPVDFFRYTVHSIHTLFTCAGFRVQELRGLGNRIESIAYIARVTAELQDESDITSSCDGLSSNDCSGEYYSAVAALGIKEEDKTLTEIHDCWG